MSKPFYLTANVTTRDSFSQWLSKHNQITYDMGTVVLTSGSVAQPNTTNGAYTSGNAHLQGIFSAPTMVATNLRGGTTSTSANLNIVSNTIFSNSSIVTVGSNTQNFNLNSNNSYITSNVVVTGSDKIFTINNQRTQISGGGFFVDCAASFSGSTFTSIANTFIDSANVVIEAETMTLGSNGSQSIDINSITNFDANTVVNGTTSTINANLVHGGTSAIFNNGVTLGSSNTDIVTLRSKILGDILPSANNTYDLGSPTMMMAQSHVLDSFVYNDIDVARDAIIHRDVLIDRNIIQKSATSSKHIVSGTTSFVPLVYEFAHGANTTNPLTITNNSVLPGATDKFTDLGSSTVRWKNAYIHDVNTANTIYSGGHSNFASTAVRDIPDRRILVANTAGRLSSFSDFSYYANTVYTPNMVASANVTAVNIHASTKSTVGTNVTLNSVGVSTFANNITMRYFSTTGAITDTSTVSTTFDVVGATTHRSDVTLTTANSRITAPNGVFSNTVTMKTANIAENATVAGTFSAGNTSVKNTIITGTLDVSGKTTSASYETSGNITAQGILVTSNTVNSTNTTSGSITTLGGMGIAKDVNIGGKLNVGGITTISGDLYVTGQTYLSSNAQLTLASSTAENLTVTSKMTLMNSTVNGSFIPDANNSYSIGNANYAWQSVYAENLYGSLSGNASSATRLQTPRKINDATFNGTADVIVSKIPVLDKTAANANLPLLFADAGATVITNNSQQSLAYSPGIFANPSQGQLYADNFNITSDEKLKDDIEIVSNALGTINKINGVSFIRKSTSKKEFGVIAQNIQKTIPEAVSGEETLSVDTNQLNAFFIEAIKELKRENDEMKIMIEELKRTR